jgi:hypothetical protein
MIAGPASMRPGRRTDARCAALVLTWLALVPAPLFASPPDRLDFDSTFNDRDAPRQAHYVATYRLAGNAHRLEVWRDGDAQLRRRTDDAIETLVLRSPGAAEWTMTVLDLKRRLRTDIDRTSLLRIGHVTDWFALAHSLTRPAGNYELTEIVGHTPGVATIAPCRWYLLAQGSQASKICWSASLQLPLAMTGADDSVEWRIVEADTRPLPASVLRVDDSGFVRKDASADIRSD